MRTFISSFIALAVTVLLSQAAPPVEANPNQFSGLFKSEFGNSYAIVFRPGATLGDVVRNEKGAVTKGTAKLYRDNEIIVEIINPDGKKRKGLIVHFSGNVYHWFEGANRTKKPIVMRKM